MVSGNLVAYCAACNYGGVCPDHDLRRGEPRASSGRSGLQHIGVNGREQLTEGGAVAVSGGPSATNFAGVGVDGDTHGERGSGHPRKGDSDADSLKGGSSPSDTAESLGGPNSGGRKDPEAGSEPARQHHLGASRPKRGPTQQTYCQSGGAAPTQSLNESTDPQGGENQRSLRSDPVESPEGAARGNAVPNHLYKAIAAGWPACGEFACEARQVDRLLVAAGVVKPSSAQVVERLFDEMERSIIEATDEEVIAEAEEDGVDLEDLARQIKVTLLNRVRQMRRGVPPAEVVERAKRIPCTCRRIDVDLYDVRGCEACDPELEEELCMRCHQWPCNCVREDRESEDERVPDNDEFPSRVNAWPLNPTALDVLEMAQWEYPQLCTRWEWEGFQRLQRAIEYLKGSVIPPKCTTAEDCGGSCCEFADADGRNCPVHGRDVEF